MSVRFLAARLLAVLAVGALVLTGCSGGSDAVDQTSGGQFSYVGATPKGTVIAADERKPAGPVSAELLDGKSQFTLASQVGKVVVLNFWATNCPPCRIESPQLDKLYRRYKSSGVNLVGIAVKDLNRGAVRSFVADNDLSYPIAYDELAKTALQLGKFPLVGLPDTVVIDRQGRVAAVYVGVVAQGDLNPVLTALAKET